MATLAGIAFGNPAHRLAWTVVFAVALGFAGATLDLVIDGWRITSVRPPEKQAVLSSWTEIGWRVGNLAAGAGALFLADRIGWRGAYLCMGALMLPGMLAAVLAPEPPSDMRPHLPHAGLVATIWAAIRELLTRLGPSALAILLLVAGFRMPGYSERDGGAALQAPGLLELRHRNRHQALRLLDRARRYLLGRLPHSADRHAAEPPHRHRGGLGLAFEPRLPGGAWRRWRHSNLDLCDHSRDRGLCVRLRVDRADHLHVDARLDRSCREPVRALDLALRLSGKHPGRFLGLRHRADRLYLVLHLDIAHRAAGGADRDLRLGQDRHLRRGRAAARRGALKSASHGSPLEGQDCPLVCWFVRARVGAKRQMCRCSG